MPVYKIAAHIYIDSDKDPEHIATSMDDGLGSALVSFPDGEVITAEVDHISLATAEEIGEKGLDEF